MSYNEPPPPPNQPPTYGGGGGYGDQPPVYGGGPAYGGQPAGTSKKAIWSLVTGILGLLCCGIILGPVAIVLSRSAKSEIATTGKEGSGLATAGMVLGIISLALGILGVILVITGVIDLNFSTSTTS